MHICGGEDEDVRLVTVLPTRGKTEMASKNGGTLGWVSSPSKFVENVNVYLKCGDFFDQSEENQGFKKN